MILWYLVLEDRQSLPCFTNSCPCIDFRKKRKKVAAAAHWLAKIETRDRVLASSTKNGEAIKKKKRSERRKQKRNKGMMAQAVFFYSLAALFLAMLSRETRPNAIDTFFRIAHQPVLFASILFVSTGSLGGNSAKNERLPTFFFFPVRAGYFRYLHRTLIE